MVLRDSFTYIENGEGNRNTGWRNQTLSFKGVSKLDSSLSGDREMQWSLALNHPANFVKKVQITIYTLYIFTLILWQLNLIIKKKTRCPLHCGRAYSKDKHDFHWALLTFAAYRRQWMTHIMKLINLYCFLFLKFCKHRKY